MAEFAHDPAIGSWFFQALPTGVKLDRMTKNARAAHWNKPRATRYRESALLTTTQVDDTEDTHQVLLCGVRVIQGSASPYPPHVGVPFSIFYKDSDLHNNTYIGEPQVLFPNGQGLPPFTSRPVAMANIIGLEIEKTDPADDDYSFVTWFGGIDWGAATGTTANGVSYNVNTLFTREFWPRAVVARPIGTAHGLVTGATDTTIGLRFRIIFGRLGGQLTGPVSPLGGSRPVGGYYINWMAQGPVAVY